MPETDGHTDAECDDCGIKIHRSHPINVVIKKEEVLVLCNNCNRKYKLEKDQPDET